MRRALVCLLLVTGCAGPRPAAAPETAPPTTVPPTTVAPTTAAPTTASPTTPPPTTAPPTSAPPVTPSPARVRYAFPVTGCRATYGRAHHDYPATDIFAKAGCAYVSPVDGRVDEVEYRDRWTGRTNRGADRGGLFVSVVGVDGVRYYGSHLRSVAPGIRPGVRVTRGTKLGEVGTTGSAAGTPPHLHFGLSWPTKPGVWWVRRGVVAPWPYLDSWRAGGDRSPVAAVAEARREAGSDAPPCEGYC
ncbi:MAG TPA: M23 family metallopeptidase [Frankiaceae bacterium]|nr:M23 family metallopeptidase [Frankiaceae bacterium]